MYEFNPIASMELLQTMRQTTERPAADLLDDTDLERRVSHARTCTLRDFVRRVFQRIANRRRAA